ncbi:hypothetical protein E8E13_005292 [Curvularia kusanoi]|uniref:Uncharacterized protein n=1 Tax=Curvularia kusanoi TaxID=90978 RepID=A0A9P4TE46_CURKU|nr:hypothetical protein E8E13_005292 [Curvularia kusanoi]
MAHAAATGIANLRDMFRPPTDKVPTDLRRALSLLNLNSLDEFEERFLATTAFLDPWCVYRDCCLLVNIPKSDAGAIKRVDILWFYTQFDEGVRRHDPRDEKEGVSWEIDKTNWTASEHEKHLYAWLLQTFRVGKTHSPFGLRYLELKNVCTAWDEVFVPIVQAVRASYSAKGRRHYGRLAMFIEERCPSRLAFPEDNVKMPDDMMGSPTPFRVVSRSTHVRGTSQTLPTKKNYDDTEKELREVYPQYGGLVERPRFKQKMEDWLELQRVRAAERKRVAKQETVQYVPVRRPQIVEQTRRESREKSLTKLESEGKVNPSPIKRWSNSFRRSLTWSTAESQVGELDTQSPTSTVCSKSPTTPKRHKIPYDLSSYFPKLSKQEPKSPLHGVTRQLQIPDHEADFADEQSQKAKAALDKQTPTRKPSWPLDKKAPMRDPSWPLITALPRPQLPQQRSPERIVHSLIQNPFSAGDSIFDNGAEAPAWSPMGALSAIPPPLRNSVDKGKTPATQHPGYEGAGYSTEISPKALRNRTTSASGTSVFSTATPSKSRSRLPAPIRVPPPHTMDIDIDVPKPIPWPGFEDSAPPSPVAAPPSPAAAPPPVPAKSPLRKSRSAKGTVRDFHMPDFHMPSLHKPDLPKPNPPSQPLPQLALNPEPRKMSHIVSKENIRAALANLTPQSSVEDLRALAEKKETPSVRKTSHTRVVSPPRLEAYNRNLFPRKDGV